MAIIVRRADGEFDKISSGGQVAVKDDGHLLISNQYTGQVAAYHRDSWVAAYQEGDCETFESEADASKSDG